VNCFERILVILNNLFEIEIILFYFRQNVEKYSTQSELIKRNPSGSERLETYDTSK
jgi:hypothetical protein